MSSTIVPRRAVRMRDHHHNAPATSLRVTPAGVQHRGLALLPMPAEPSRDRAVPALSPTHITGHTTHYPEGSDPRADWYDPPERGPFHAGPLPYIARTKGLRGIRPGNT